MIQFTKIHKTYPKQINRSPAQHALKGISFALQKGGTLGLIGQNGAGKSTTIRLIMGYMRADHGQIAVLKSSPSSPHIRRHIGYLPEQSTFPPNLNCMELLHFAGRCCDMPKKKIQERAEKLLKQLDIWSSRYRRLNQLSKGMQQRASFAAALIHDPELLILDEPMSGLDPIGRADIIALIHELRSQDKSILFCSHLLDDVERITDHVAILHQGSVLYDGHINALCQQWQRWNVALKNGTSTRVNTPTELTSLLQQQAAEIQSVTPEQESLQDAFVRIITQEPSL